MKFLKPIYLPALAIVLLAACSTEVDLNAPKVTKTFVFGLLDAKADTQFIRINRTFLGEGNNFLYASIRDSVEYKFSDFTAKVEGINSAGQVVHSFTLDSLTVQKQAGLFADRQTVYWFKTNQLNSNYNYRISVEFNNGGENVSAETNLIASLENDLNIARPSQGQGVRLVNSNPGTENPAYNDLQIKYTPTANAKRFDAVLRFYFVEKKWSGTPYASELLESSQRQLDWPIGSRKVENLGDIDYRVNGRGFFNFLNNALGNTPSTISREIGKGPGKEEECFDFILTVGNDELSTWMDVNQPVTGIITERPYYSNIDGGIGLFASRTTQMQKDLKTWGTGVNAQHRIETKYEICLGLSNYHLRFCSVSAQWDASQPYYYLNRVW